MGSASKCDADRTWDVVVKVMWCGVVWRGGVCCVVMIGSGGVCYALECVLQGMVMMVVVVVCVWMAVVYCSSCYFCSCGDNV